MNSLGQYGDDITPEKIAEVLPKQADVIIGGELGDEGKGGDAYMLAENKKYELLVSPIGGPNAGHTVRFQNGTKFVGHNMPGSAVTGQDVFLGQGKYINVQGLESELKALKELGSEPKVKIAKSAHSLFSSFHGRLDGAIEDVKKENGNDVGTTKSGMGPGVATRGLRNSITMDYLAKLSGNDLSIAIDELLLPFNPKLRTNSEDIRSEILQYQTKLKLLIDQGIVEIVDDMYAQEVYRSGGNMLIEGAQSWKLGMYGGAYPFNTSTDTSFLGVLSSLGITPTPDRISEYLITKVFPSAVGNHKFPGQISKFFPHLINQEKEFAIETLEKGSTTGRPRDISLPDAASIANYINNDPYVDVVSIRKFDVIEDFKKIMGLAKLPVIIGSKENGKLITKEIEYSDEALIGTFRDTINNLVGNQKGFNIPIIMGYGATPNDSRIDTL